MWHSLALDGSNWQSVDLFDFQTNIEVSPGQRCLNAACCTVEPRKDEQFSVVLVLFGVCVCDSLAVNHCLSCLLSPALLPTSVLLSLLSPPSVLLSLLSLPFVGCSCSPTVQEMWRISSTIKPTRLPECRRSCSYYFCETLPKHSAPVFEELLQHY